MVIERGTLEDQLLFSQPADSLKLSQTTNDMKCLSLKLITIRNISN